LVLILDHIHSAIGQLGTGPSVLLISVSSMCPLMLTIGINVGGCSTCWIWWVPRQAGAGAVSHTTVGLDYQLITTTCSRKHDTFHCHSSLLDQVLTRQHKITESVRSSFLWIIL